MDCFVPKKGQKQPANGEFNQNKITMFVETRPLNIQFQQMVGSGKTNTLCHKFPFSNEFKFLIQGLNTYLFQPDLGQRVQSECFHIKISACHRHIYTSQYSIQVDAERMQKKERHTDVNTEGVRGLMW